MPAQVAIEARKRSKGGGADPSPPARGGWSVRNVKPLYSASTRLPPGKLTVMVVVIAVPSPLVETSAAPQGYSRRACDHEACLQPASDSPIGRFRPIDTAP